MLPVVGTCSSLGAGGSVDLAGQPSDDTWVALDREIDSLSASLAPEHQIGPKIWCYLRVSEFWSDAGTGDEQLGTVVANARLASRARPAT